MPGQCEAAATRILLVEDEGVVRLTTADFLADAGFEITEAWNGPEAVKLLDGPSRFDVLFTDVQMPGKPDGVGLATHARRCFPTIHVLITSGYAANLASRLAAFDPEIIFVRKPYALGEIVPALRKLTETQPK